jgi:hypothetical protein
MVEDVVDVDSINSFVVEFEVKENKLCLFSDDQVSIHPTL